MAYRQSKAQAQEKPDPYLGPPASVPIPAYDPIRTVRFVVFGTMMGPLLARWNHFLEHRFPLRPLSTQAAASKHVAKGAGAPVENVQRIMLSSTGGTTSNKVSITALAKRVAADQACMAPLGVSIHHLSKNCLILITYDNE
jgi:protein Mpv17